MCSIDEGGSSYDENEETKSKHFLVMEAVVVGELTNTFSQIAGLSVVLLLEQFVSRQEDFHSATVVSVSFNVLVGALFSGVLLGITQWFVLRHVLPALRWRMWVGMTVLGVYVAWVSGMLVLTPVFTSVPLAAVGQFRIPVWYLLIVSVGFVVGGILGLAQLGYSIGTCSGRATGYSPTRLPGDLQ